MCYETTGDGLLIHWPPREKSKRKLYRVVYIIDINADSDKQAADQVHRIITDPDTIKPIFQVLRPDRRISTVDISRNEVQP
jgi:hypothetical protein